MVQTEPLPSQQTGLDLWLWSHGFGPRQRESLSIIIISPVMGIMAETANCPQYPLFPFSLVIEPPIFSWTHVLPNKVHIFQHPLQSVVAT